MEVCGIPEISVIKKSRKCDYYFDEEFSPFLIEEDEAGILRIPASRTLADASRCRDELFLDFVSRCLELDPAKRWSASEALQHEWIKTATRMKSKPSADKRGRSSLLQPP